MSSGRLPNRFPLYIIPWWHFFESFLQKKFNPIVVMQSLRTQLASKCNIIQLCIRNMCCYRLCLSYFYITPNENVLFKRKHFRFLVVGNLTLKWAVSLKSVLLNFGSTNRGTCRTLYFLQKNNNEIIYNTKKAFTLFESLFPGIKKITLKKECVLIALDVQL